MLRQLTFDRLFPRFFTGWCLAAFVETVLSSYGFDDKSFFTSVSPLRFLLILFAVTAVLTAAAVKYNTKAAETRLMVGAVFGYLFLLALLKSDFWFSMGLALIMLFALLYATHRDRMNLAAWQPSRRQTIAIIAAAGMIFTAFNCAVTLCRYYGHISSTFDLGIFSQMFYYMKETGLPLTTCERNGLLSHFSVHVSPIWYVLLPGYLVFPSPAYLQVMQALVLASAVVPLYLLMRRRGLTERTIIAVCLCFFAYPALTGGCFYDVHENCFLTPLLFWMFYFFESGRRVPLAIFTLLTLTVKEDAPVYVAAFALYLLCSRKAYKTGLCLLIGAILYFVGVIALLSAFGEGAMTASRFTPFMTDVEGGMLQVLRNIFFDPAYLFTEVFTAEKVRFLLLMLVPLAFLPFCTRHVSRLLLLIPILAINVMPDWVYQYSTHFQYVFGGLALLFYLAVLNLGELPRKSRGLLLPLAVCCAVLLATADLSGFAGTISYYFENRAQHQQINAVLTAIPADAAVRCDGFYLPAVSARREVYDTSEEHEADYVVLDLRDSFENSADADADYAADDSYICETHIDDLIAVYRRKGD